MPGSVAATELAKLGKCEAMIKKCVNHPHPAPAKRSRSPQGNDNTLRGEFAHFRYEAAVMRFMHRSSATARRCYQLIFTATVAVGVLTLLAAWITG